jgi:hypothetical protein
MTVLHVVLGFAECVAAEAATGKMEIPITEAIIAIIDLRNILLPPSGLLPC